MNIELDRRALFAGVSGLVLAGCGEIVGPPPAPKLYVLKPSLPRDLPGGKVNWALSIQMPDATSGLDSDRIAILLPPSTMDYYADSAWADRLPALVQSNFLEAFEASGRINAVARDSEGVHADYILSTDLRDFEARLDQSQGAPLATVRIGARIVKSRTREIAGYTSASNEVRASVNSVAAAVEALNTALADVLAKLVPWTLDRPGPV
jgi:cholesterol transport system auxiliary component